MEQYILVYKCHRCGSRLKKRLPEPTSEQEEAENLKRIQRFEKELSKEICSECGKLGLEYDGLISLDNEV